MDAVAVSAVDEVMEAFRGVTAPSITVRVHEHGQKTLELPASFSVEVNHLLDPYSVLSLV